MRQNYGALKIEKDTVSSFRVPFTEVFWVSVPVQNH